MLRICYMLRINRMLRMYDIGPKDKIYRGLCDA